MKKHLIILALIIINISFWSCKTEAPGIKSTQSALELFQTPERPAGQEDVIELRCDPIDTVRMAIIGLGMRGEGAVHRYTFIDGAKIVALCDLEAYNLERANKMLSDKGLAKADEYTGSEDYKTICERDDIDLIYICTNFIMDYRLIFCLRNGLPLDQDVYDAAEWSAISELSEKSVELGSAPVVIPDFTRGSWDKVKQVKYYME